MLRSHHSSHESRPRRRSFRLAAGAALTISALWMSSFALSGCSEGQTTDPTSGLTPTTQEAALFAPPSMDELSTALEMSKEQIDTLDPSLSAWHSASTERGADRVQKMHDFLVDSSDTLDREQLVSLLEMLKERRETRREAMALERHGRRGQLGERGPRGPRRPNGVDEDHPGMRGPRGSRGGGFGFGGGFTDLDLTDEQEALIESARTAHHAAVKLTREKYGDDAWQNEAFRDEMNALRQAFQAQVADILTPEQLAQLEGDRKERFVSHLESRIEQLEERAEDRLTFLTKMLDLSSDQQAQITALHAEHITAIRGIIDGLNSGALTLEEVHDQMRDRDRVRDQIEGILTEEQLEIFELLGPGSGHGMRGPGHGPGHGFRSGLGGPGMHNGMGPGDCDGSARQSGQGMGPCDRQMQRSRTI